MKATHVASWILLCLLFVFCPAVSGMNEREEIARARGRREENEPEMMPPRTAEEYVSQQFRLRNTEAYSRSPAAIKKVVDHAKITQKLAWISDLTDLLVVATKESQDARSLLDDYFKKTQRPGQDSPADSDGSGSSSFQTNLTNTPRRQHLSSQLPKA
ncbi:hypothetical protein FA10DRAFT_260864 [Acaromyces ingoldii]|uniref:Uncharacterized protein n=1 Tax=Acaromyces ingoldii TaxID=215250 RepID=A0A316YHM4_9BASI|nr:hypothetical protein FA10DRAFT_260864 [Acaromyces ingoldii]PWN88937.1 hypothetical protein FA10DRAFT_260864 [Acaromyces ingoldii]